MKMAQLKNEDVLAVSLSPHVSKMKTSFPTRYTQHFGVAVCLARTRADCCGEFVAAARAQVYIFLAIPNQAPSDFSICAGICRGWAFWWDGCGMSHLIERNHTSIILYPVRAA
jgi:hypothetical protein